MFKYKFKLFTISLFAIWVVLFIKNVDVPVYWGKDWCFVGLGRLLTLGNLIALLSLIMIVVALLGLNQLRHRLKGSPDDLSTTIAEVHDKSYEYINMLATLVTLFSVIFVPVDTFRDFLVFLVLMAAISICFLKTNLYYSNPIFAALGYRLYTVKTNSESFPDDAVAIYHGTLNKHDAVCYFHVSDKVYYLIRK